ncbi:MAG: ribosome recycling factor [Balneolales bacterium]|nr:ribosome recycling factor [Balneolales bacterium]
MILSELQIYFDTAKEEMDEAIDFLKREFGHIRAGKASPALLDGVKVDYYGSQTPISQVANVSAPEARLLVVQPWEKAMIAPIERAIQASNLGLNPQNDGILIRIPLPMLTEERRLELVKVARDTAEKARVSIRNSRRDANDGIKKEVKDSSLPEDSRYGAEEEIQKLTDSHIQKVDKLLEDKEKEITSI